MKSLMIAMALFMSQLSPGEMPLEDPAEEARAQSLMREIRCVTCVSEPISQSNGRVADNMRARVREMVAEGATDAEIRAWFTARYKDYVLFRPPGRGWQGVVLWGLPFFLVVGIGGALIVTRLRRSDSEIEVVGADAFDHENGTS